MAAGLGSARGLPAEPYRSAVVTVLPFGTCAGTCAACANGIRSQSEVDWPGIFVSWQSCAAEFGLVASCATIGNAATQPVRLNEARAASGIM